MLGRKLSRCVFVGTSVSAQVEFGMQALLNKNAKVYIAARSQEKATRAMDELKTATGKEAFFLKVDLADLKSIKAAVEDFTRSVQSFEIWSKWFD